VPDDGTKSLIGGGRRVFITKSELETEDLGEKLGLRLSPGDVVSISGELGAGKTCLVRGIARGLGSSSKVKSPSFTIINKYVGKCPIYHFDLFRVEGYSSFEELGCYDFFGGDGVVLIEWGEKVSALLPEDRLEVEIKFKSRDEREITLSPHGRISP
jgi:tRNA threonylcarbamoyladenosine biosynthesis protein TsaE